MTRKQKSRARQGTESLSHGWQPAARSPKHEAPQRLGILYAVWLTMMMPLSAWAQVIEFLPTPPNPGSLGPGPINIPADGLAIVGTENVDNDFSGTINVDPAGTLAKVGTGTFTIDGAMITGGEFHVLDGAVAQTSGNTNVTTLVVGSGIISLPVSALNVSGGTINFTSSLRVGDFGGTGTVNQTGGAVTFVPTGTSGVSLNIGNQGGTGTYNLSGGTLSFNGANTGFVILGRNDNTARLPSDGVLNLSGNGIMTVFNNGALIIGSNGDNGGATPGRGVINQTGGTLTIESGSTLFLSAFGNGTYNLNGGTLQIGGASLIGNLNNTPGTYTFDLGGGTIQVIGSALAGTVNATLMGGTTSTIDTNSIGATWSGALSGGGALAKAGAGTLTLSGPNTYTGATTVAAGTLAAGADNTLPGLTAVTVESPGILDLAGFNQSIGSLAGAGSVTLGSATITTGNDNTSTTFSGVMSGVGALDKVGTGTFVLAGNNSYTGGTTISAGTLQLGAGGTSGSIVEDVADNGSLAFNRSDTVTFPGVISGTGSVNQAGTGVTILTADNPYSGGTTVTAGTLAVGDPAHPAASLSGGGPINVAPGGTLGGFGSVTGSVTNNGTVAAGNATPGFGSTGVAADSGIFTINGDLKNFATLNLASDPVDIGNVLAIHGDYSAFGTPRTLIVNTYLNAGGPLQAQLTDRLLVFGSTTGTTMVEVKNPNHGPGGSTGQDADDGISLIQVSGTSNPRAFVLPGGYVTAGTPTEYHLNAFGPGSPFGSAVQSESVLGGSVPLNWDFRLQEAYVGPGGEVEPGPGQPGQPEPPESGPTGPDGQPPPGELAPNPPGGDPEAPPLGARPEVAPQVPAYLSTARGLFQAGLLDIGTLHQRLGEIRDDQTLDRQGMGEVFIRAYGGLFNYTTNRSFTDFGYNFDEDYAAVQFGGNYTAINNAYGTLRVGLAGAIGRMWLQPSAIDGMSKALFNTQNFFGTATWQDRTGWYVDGILMGGLFDGRYTTPNRGQTTGMNGTSVGASVETGFPFPLPWDFSFEPQAQIVWQHLNFQNRTDVDDIDVDLGNPDQVTARVGFRLKRPFETDNGMLFTPYLKANVLQGIGSSGDVLLSGVSFGTGNVGTALQVGGGVTGTLTRNLSLYGDVSWQSQVGNGGGFRGWVLNGGLRFVFGQPRAPAPALVPTAVPAPQAARSYLVFFDWDKATLTGRARQIIREAAESSTRVAYTRIAVNGHTDTSGTPQYNMGLSLRRAHAVAGELMRDGVPAGAITIRGFGQTDLLVPTGPGVREPQNRRVEIVMQ
jgi:outer membrane autotransporter protein